MDGFPAVSRIALLAALRKFRQEGKPENQAYIQTLLLLLAQVEDTNILSRSDRPTLEQAQADARAVLDQGAEPLPRKGCRPCEIDRIMKIALTFLQACRKASFLVE